MLYDTPRRTTEVMRQSLALAVEFHSGLELKLAEFFFSLHSIGVNFDNGVSIRRIDTLDLRHVRSANHPAGFKRTQDALELCFRVRPLLEVPC